jgi:hypothetical protein
MVPKLIILSLLTGSLLLAVDQSQTQGQPTKQNKTGEAEKGYVSDDIQTGWAYGHDPKVKKQEDDVFVPPKVKRDVITILEESLQVQKEQLKEQRKIRAILEEQFDPKPHMLKKEDGTECVANSSADCFEFPLIAEAKRVPVMANYLKNPHDEKAVAEWKEWFAVYLNHTFDIGRATEYDSAQNGSNTFKTDFKRDGYDSSTGYYYVAKDQHNSRLLNAFGSKGLSLKILLGKTPELDLYAMDQIAMFIKKNPALPVELVFVDRKSAEIYNSGAHTLSFVGQAFSQSNVSKRIGNATDFPKELQSTPAFSPSFKDAHHNKSKVIKSGKVDADKLANSIVEWMIFEKIVDPAQLNDSRIWKDIGGFGSKFIKETYNKDIKGGSN